MDDDSNVPRIVIFGVGGAGNRIINSLADRTLPSTSLVAIDTDNQQLLANNDKVETILMDQDFKDRYLHSQNLYLSKDVIQKDLWKIEQKIDNADIVLIIAGLGRVTGTHMGTMISEIAKKKNVLSLVLGIFPFATERSNVKTAENNMDKLRGKSDALIITNNNLQCFDKSIPVVRTLSLINDSIVLLISTLVFSLTEITLKKLTVKDLRYFFQEDLIYMFNYNQGISLNKTLMETFNQLFGCLDKFAMKKALIVASSAFELRVTQLRDATEMLGNNFELDETKWVTRINDDIKNEINVMLIVGARELDFSNVEAQRPISQQDEQQTVENYYDEPQPMPHIPALIGIKNEEPPEEKEDEKVKKPGEGPKQEPKKEAEPTVEKIESHDEEEIAAELTGTPYFKKKGQKRIDEYSDEFGIGYV